MPVTIMKYKDVNKWNSSNVVGVTEITLDDFRQLAFIFKVSLAVKHIKGGITSKLSVEDMLLATFQYNPKTTTYKYLAENFNIHESNMYRTIKFVEDGLQEMDLVRTLSPMRVNINRLHKAMKNIKEAIPKDIS